MDDRVGEDATRLRVAVDDVARGGDLVVGEHVGRRGTGSRREERDRGLGRAEHQRRPGRAVDEARVDRARPTFGIGHAQEAFERGGARADPATRVDEMRLHVDHRRVAVERVGCRVELVAPRVREPRRSRRRARRRSPAASRPFRGGRARGRAPTAAAGRRRARSRRSRSRPRGGRVRGGGGARTRRSTGAGAAAARCARPPTVTGRAVYSARSKTAVLRARGLAAGDRGDDVREEQRADPDDGDRSGRDRRFGHDVDLTGEEIPQRRVRSRCRAGSRRRFRSPTATVDCQATTPASCRRVKPNVFRSARSCRRRRTDVTSVSASATTAPAARATPRYSGVELIER